MELYILRHAKADPLGIGGVGRDKDRALTDEGIATLRWVVRGMKALGLTFDLILSSPYLRARQTAEIVAEELDVRKILELSPELAPGGDCRVLIDTMSTRCDPSASILLVGHEPTLSRLISVLISGDERTGINLKKAGLCKVTIGTLRYGRCAMLEWLLAPAQMKRIRP